MLIIKIKGYFVFFFLVFFRGRGFIISFCLICFILVYVGDVIGGRFVGFDFFFIEYVVNVYKVVMGSYR